MPTNNMGYKSNNNRDIDDFIGQLLASHKFDELAEKVADKAVYKIKEIKTPIGRLERFSESSNKNETVELSPKYREKQSAHLTPNIRENNEQMSKIGRIDTQAVMKQETSLPSDHLKLKYKYLTRNAFEKKKDNERAPDDEDNFHNPVLRNYETPEDTTKKASAEEVITQDEDINVSKEAQASNQDISDKDQHVPNNEFEEDVSQNRNEGKDNDNDAKDNNSENADHNRDNNHENVHSEDDNRNRHNPKNEDVHEEYNKREPELAHKPLNTRPEFKSAGKNTDSRNEENSSSEENREILERSIEKTKEVHEEELHKTAEDYHASGKEKLPQFRANSRDEEDNKVTSDDYDQYSHETTSSTNKPQVRQEGNKFYAFVQNPEYAEYHQELAKETVKNKGTGPADFL